MSARAGYLWPGLMALSEAMDRLERRWLGGEEDYPVITRDLPPRLGSRKPPDCSAVLVVDDDQDSIEIMGVYLDRWGYNWKAVTTAAQAATEMATGRYRKLLLDWRGAASGAPRMIAEAALKFGIDVAIWTAAPEYVPADERKHFVILDKADIDAIEAWLRSVPKPPQESA